MIRNEAILKPFAAVSILRVKFEMNKTTSTRKSIKNNDEKRNRYYVVTSLKYNEARYGPLTFLRARYN